MWKIVGISACLVVVAFDAIAGYFFIKARKDQNLAEHSHLIFECEKRSDHAASYTSISRALVLIASSFATTLGGVLSHIPSVVPLEPWNRLLNIACLLVIWILYAVVLALWTFGERPSKDEALCRFTYENNTLEAAIVCIIHATISILFHVTSGFFRRLWLREQLETFP